MTGIKLYVEGGGDTQTSRQTLRRGLNTFFAPITGLLRPLEWRWTIELCGNTRETWKAWSRHCDAKYPFALLVVDSERRVDCEPAEYLRRNRLNLPPKRAADAHLMVQCMETWLIADTDGLRQAFGKRFHEDQLRRTWPLEDMSPANVTEALRGALGGTYDKIRDGARALAAVKFDMCVAALPHLARLRDRFDALLKTPDPHAPDPDRR